VKDNRLLDGTRVRDRILAEVAERVAQAAKQHPLGHLVSISIGEQPEVAVYIRNQAKGAAKAGIPFDQQFWPSDLSQEECKARLVGMNDDPNVLGVILQRPMPRQIHVRSLQSAIHPLKDVEGMNPASIGNIVYNDLALAPCTAAASIELIKETGLNLQGLEVVDRPLGDRRQTRCVHAHGRGRHGHRVSSHDPLGGGTFAAGRRGPRRGR
jgi:methylenetetrahydrofolate dehydrogenase (NADP+)/methenyltetrahydrofolate cyclohydrolase